MQRLLYRVNDFLKPPLVAQYVQTQADTIGDPTRYRRVAAEELSAVVADSVTPRWPRAGYRYVSFDSATYVTQSRRHILTF
jgi:hypothetical protein